MAAGFPSCGCGLQLQSGWSNPQWYTFTTVPTHLFSLSIATQRYRVGSAAWVALQEGE
jgi:hypothetical protein